MKQGKYYTNLILWIFLAAIIAYFGYNVASSLTEPLTTSTAIEYEAGAGCYTTGFVVRDEEILTSAYDITFITCAEGAHVAANEAVATGYLSDGAQQRQSRIQDLQEQLTQLQYAWSASSSLADQAALDTEIQSNLLSLAKFTARRDMNSAQDLSPELKARQVRAIQTRFMRSWKTCRTSSLACRSRPPRIQDPSALTTQAPTPVWPTDMRPF